MRVISGSARGKKLQCVEGIDIRPTLDRVKESVFNMIAFDIPDSSVLDLFSGSGALGIEALSRGAKRAVFVDSAKAAVALVRENLRRTKFTEQATVLQSDYLSYLSRCRETFGIIFLDPPYAESFLENSLQKIVEFDILASGGIIVTERPEGKELPFVFDGYTRSKDYRYGKTLVTLYRKQ